MASTTRSSGFNYGVQAQPGKTATRTSGFYYGAKTPDSETLANGYTYVASNAQVSRITTEVLSAGEVSTGLLRLTTEVLSPGEAQVQLPRITVEVLSPWVDQRRRRPTVYLTM